MTKRQKVLTVRFLSIFAVVAVPGALSWELLRPRIPDPIYEGKPLSYWLSGRRIISDKGQEAVRHAGTNAIPLLLQMLRAKDSPLKRRWDAFAAEHGLFWCSFVPAEIRHQQAFDGFETLGTLASNAVPELIEIFESNVSEHSQLWVTLSLGQVDGHSKLPIRFLLSARTNANDIVRLYAVQALARMRIHTEVVVPALISSLDDPTEYVRGIAVEGLGELGPQARIAAPRLLTLYDSTPDAEPMPEGPVVTRDLIEDTLNKIDPAAAARARDAK